MKNKLIYVSVVVFITCSLLYTYYHIHQSNRAKNIYEEGKLYSDWFGSKKDTVLEGIVLPHKQKDDPNNDSLSVKKRNNYFMSDNRDASLLKGLSNAVLGFAFVQNFEKNRNIYLLGFKRYEYKDQSNRFFIQREKKYITHLAIDSFSHNHYHRSLQRTPVNYFYDDRDKIIYFEISKTSYRVLEAIFALIIFIIFIPLSIYFYIIAPIKILISISKGSPFSPLVIKLLKRINLFTCLLFLNMAFLPLIFHFSIYNKFSEYFSYTYINNEYLKIFCQLLVIAVFTTALYKAFKKGHQLQQEQDLTI